VSTSASRAAASPDDQAVTAQRCAAQLLCGGPAGSAEEVAGRLLAIQAQDPRGARLAIRARSAGLAASDVDSALIRRSLVVSWLNRGTLGWVSRDSVTGPHREIVTVNGLFRPFALAGGRAVATWTITSGQVVLAPFAVLDDETQAALATDAADVTRFLCG
jgi:hypothetical protein